MAEAKSTAGPYDQFIGELTPGDYGWLPLDEAGNPVAPATIQPPRIGEYPGACHVYLADNGEFLTASGAPLSPPLQSNVEKRVNEGEETPPPLILALNPNTAISTDPTDIDMIIDGEGFTENSVIVFNGYDEPTTLLSPTQVSTIVKPSIFGVAVCPVLVRGEGGDSNTLEFEFTAPSGGTRRQDDEGRDDPSILRNRKR